LRHAQLLRHEEFALLQVRQRQFLIETLDNHLSKQIKVVKTFRLNWENQR
jgi:hypothetical protein